MNETEDETKCPKCKKRVTSYRHKERDGLCVNCLIDAYVKLRGPTGGLFRKCGA